MRKRSARGALRLKPTVRFMQYGRGCNDTAETLFAAGPTREGGSSEVLYREVAKTDLDNPDAGETAPSWNHRPATVPSRRSPMAVQHIEREILREFNRIILRDGKHDSVTIGVRRESEHGRTMGVLLQGVARAPACSTPEEQNERSGARSSGMHTSQRNWRALEDITGGQLEDARASVWRRDE